MKNQNKMKTSVECQTSLKSSGEKIVKSSILTRYSVHKAERNKF